jgi:hypothetical protein
MITLNLYPELFRDNKFTCAYFSIINKAKSENRKKLEKTDLDYMYYEKHHIKPRCLGGRDDNNNLVLLTAFQHFCVHWLLVKMCIQKRHILILAHSLRFMKNENKISNVKCLAKLYELAKHEISQAASFNNLHRVCSLEHRKRLSEVATGENNSMFGKTHPEKTLEKMSEIKKGNKYRCKSYDVIMPSGESVLVTERNKFCEETGLGLWGFLRSANEGIIYEGYKVTEIKKEISKSKVFKHRKKRESQKKDPIEHRKLISEATGK